MVWRAAAACGLAGLIAAAIFLLEPFPPSGDRAPETAGTADEPYPVELIEEWEREAESRVSLGLLASPGFLGANRVLVERTLVVARGDTMMRLFLRAGVPRSQADAAIRAMRPVYDPRRIVPGQRLIVTCLAGDAALKKHRVHLRKARLSTGPASAVAIERRAGGFAVRKVIVQTEKRLARSSGKISSSLYRAAGKAALPQPVLLRLVRVFSWDVDFQREIRAGDGFDVAWETRYTRDGRFVDHGEMLYGALTLRGRTLELFRFTGPEGAGYFDRNGAGARKPLMRTPIDGARLSSKFGRRRHPVLGYTRMHRGVDFAARPGTPILAAGDGRIAYAGRKGSYGLYVRIRHNSRHQTAYAHMRAVRRGIRRGVRVRQGQVIGYVGSTGRSTGPHLHYEILVDGRQVNPLSISMTSQVRLKGDDLAAFHIYRGSLERRIADIEGTGFEQVSRRQ